jgi:8-oxo-dGTP pyrophosphatase MutT (NUDIX family)
VEITRHFTSTVLIVHKDKVLLHRHKTRGSLLPVGGHVDRDELPQETALREAQEEAGLEIKLYDTDGLRFNDVQVLVRPAHMLLVNINPYHQHIDFIFYASATTDQVQPAAGESPNLHWYGRDELLATPMPENVRGLALEALELLGQDQDDIQADTLIDTTTRNIYG